MYAIATGGRLLQTVAVSAASAVDWDDVALGPDGDRARDNADLTGEFAVNERAVRRR